MFIKEKETLAIEITSRCIRVLSLKKIKSNYELTSFAEVPFQNSSNSIRLNDNEELVNALKTAIKISKFKNKNASIYISDKEIFEKEFLFDYSMEVYDIEIKLENDIRKIVPFDSKEEVSFDFAIVNNTSKNLSPKGNPKNLLKDLFKRDKAVEESVLPEKKKVLFSACKKSSIDEVCGFIKKAGLNPVIVEAEKYCVQRGYEEFVLPQILDFTYEDLVAYVDIGDNGIKFKIFKGTDIIYGKDFGNGGNELTKIISSEYSISNVEAERIKCNTSSQNTEFEDEIMVPYRKRVMESVKSGLQNFYSSTEYSNVHYVVLAGGGSNITSMKTEFEKYFSLPIYLADPVSSIILNKKVDRDTTYSKSSSIIGLLGLGVRELRSDY